MARKIQGNGGGCTPFLGLPGQVGTHLLLWMDLLSAGAGTLAGSRTSQTKGQAWGRQSRVEQRSPCSRSWRGLVLRPRYVPASWTHLPLWMDLLSAGTGTLAGPRTSQIKGRTVGEGSGSYGTKKPLQQELEGPCTLFLGPTSQAGTHLPLWMDLFSVGARILVGPRTSQTKGL